MSKNSRVYVISDTHFGHEKIIQFEKEKRPYPSIEEHDLDLLQRWNSVVRPRDTVWHLGDVFFGDGYKILPHLNGYKKLVLGNHDAGKEEVLMQHFDKIFGITSFDDYILSHVPVHPYQVGKHFRFRGNIHGHMHSERMDDPRYACVSVEQQDLTPRLLTDVIKELKSREFSISNFS